MNGHTTSAPLLTLLSWAWTAFTIEADNLFEAASRGRWRIFRISLPMWANGLRLIPEEGVTVDELRARAHAACNLGGLERWGWITLGRTRGDLGYGSHRGIDGGTLLRPTPAGAYARERWPLVIEEVEARWRRRFGDDAVDALAGAASVRSNGGMPWAPAEVHPSDGFRTHVIGEKACDEATPVVASLGQTLTAMTIRNERDAHVSLPLAANVLRVIGAGAARIRDLPERSGVSREAIAMATNFLRRRDLAEPAPERSIRLTATGRDALDDYHAKAAAADDGQMRMALRDLLLQREALSAGFVPPEGCWRGERPYLAQTRRLLNDPLSALPWHPMVLHRGGWPDGS